MRLHPETNRFLVRWAAQSSNSCRKLQRADFSQLHLDPMDIFFIIVKPPPLDTYPPPREGYVKRLAFTRSKNRSAHARMLQPFLIHPFGVLRAMGTGFHNGSCRMPVCGLFLSGKEVFSVRGLAGTRQGDGCFPAFRSIHQTHHPPRRQLSRHGLS